MKKLFFILFAIANFNCVVAQINTGGTSPGTAPNSGVQPLPSGGAQTTGPDFQPSTPYIQPTTPVATPSFNTQPAPVSEYTTPPIQTQPTTTTSATPGMSNPVYTTPGNTINPGSPTSPPRE